MAVSAFTYEKKVCPLCQQEGVPFHEAHFAPGKVSWVKCPHDGLVYQNPRLDDNSIQSLFGSSDYVQGGDAKTALGYYDYFKSEPALTATAKYKIKKIEKKFSGKSLKILEVGCASGVFVKVCQDRGHQAEGVDVSTILTEYGRSHYGINIYTGFFEKVDYPAASFDVVTLYGSLGAFYDPISVLQKVRSILKPDGIFIFNVPVLDGLLPKLYGKKLWSYRPSSQVLYSKKSAEKLIELAHLHILQVRRDVQALSLEKLAYVSGLRFFGRLAERFGNLFLTLPLPSVYEFTACSQN